MKTRHLFLAATALVALASCTSDTFTGTEDDARLAKGDQAITFGFDVSNATRADGAAAATKLNRQFIVYGEKSETADGAAPVTDASSTHQLVFQNYQVNYVDGSAYTTTSNTKGWEYVGFAHSNDYQSHITTSTTDAQTIKYWDYSATNYVFTAFSAKQADLTSGAVSVTKVTSKTTDNKVFDKGYDVVLAAAADATKLYFSDRLVIDQGTGANRDAMNAYGGNATLTFRNGISQIRVAMFETIPGYSVTIDKFYYVDNATPSFATMATANTSNFAANVPNIKTTEGVTLHVTYYPSGARLNQPKIAVDGTPANYITLGTGLFGSNLGVDRANATFDTADGSDEDEEPDYTTVFPQEENNKSLKLKIDYTLTAPVTGETIHVYGATAEIPAEYLQWKPNFKYTYIFKICDNTNGKTKLPDGVSPDSPEGLYPITFDAVQIVAEDGQAEYITTVSEPSITTFGVNSTTGKYVYGGNEYAAGSDIYATFMEGSTVKTPTLGGEGAQHVNVFKVTTPDATNFPITEAAVAEAIANPASITNPVYTFNGVDTYTPVASAEDLTAGTTYYKADGDSRAPGDTGYEQTVAVAGTDYVVAPKLTVTNINADGATNFTAAPAVVSTVPGEDGINITQNALKLTGVAATTTTTAYAIEYEASDAWTGTYKKVYKVIKVTAAP